MAAIRSGRKFLTSLIFYNFLLVSSNISVTVSSVDVDREAYKNGKTEILLNSGV